MNGAAPGLWALIFPLFPTLDLVFLLPSWFNWGFGDRPFLRDFFSFPLISFVVQRSSLLSAAAFDRLDSDFAIIHFFFSLFFSLNPMSWSLW